MAKNMDIEVVNAGNCIICGKPLKLAVFPGSGEPCDSIFFCKECEQKVKNDRKRPESNARSATDELAEKMHITKEEALNKMKAAMGVNKGQWIPVSEKLPEDGKMAIFTDGYTMSIERYKADAIDHFYPEGRYFNLEDAVAWMPLPEQYKAESEEKNVQEKMD